MLAPSGRPVAGTPVGVSLGDNGALASASTMRPSPSRRPVTPGPSPVAERVPRLTVTVSSLTSRSDPAVTSTVAASAEGVAAPVKTTVVPLKVTPAGLPESARVKSVRTLPPEKLSGTERRSPATSPRPSASAMAAVSVASPSVAVASGVESTTSVGSSSAMVTTAEEGLPAATPSGSVPTETVKVSSRSSSVSSMVAMVKVCEAVLAAMVTLAGQAA